MATEIWINIGSGNGLLPDGTKPLPEPMLTYHQSSPVAFTWGQFHTKCSIYPWHEFENHQFKVTATFPRGQWVNSLWPSGTVWHRSSWSSLVQARACHLFGTKPLPKPMKTDCKLDPREHNLILIKLIDFSLLEFNFKILSAKWWPFCWGPKVFREASQGCCNCILDLLHRLPNAQPGNWTQDDCHFADNISKFVFLYENFCVATKICPQGSN